jgi:hypothetical protein
MFRDKIQLEEYTYLDMMIVVVTIHAYPHCRKGDHFG